MTDTEVQAHQARLLVLQTSYRSASPHLSSSLSVLDILICLLAEPSLDSSEMREVYLSKGHAALGMYASLVSSGRLALGDLDSYCSDGSVFEGHVNSKIPGIPLSTGSLGHAGAFALGRALGDLRSGSKRNHWVVLSDGELDEGSNWEAFLVSAHRGLPNLHFVVDRNGLQSFTSTEETSTLEPLDMKFAAFGLGVSRVDGHDHSQLKKSILEAERAGRPSVVIAETKKGYGLKAVEDNPVLYHYKPASQDLVKAYEAETNETS